MITIKKILVPADLTDVSVPAVGYALSLAKGYGAEVILFHVVPPEVVKKHFSGPYVPGELVSPTGPTIDISPQPDMENLLQTRTQLLRNFLEQKIGHELLHTAKINPVVRLGNVVEEIIAMAKEEQCDLIVITSHGARWNRLFSRSFTERVVREAPCPVLSIQPSAEVRTEKDERVPAKLIEKWAA